jgi:hypothetical protein
MRATGKVKFWFVLKLAFNAITDEFLNWEERMRKISGAAVAMILGIAFYFTLFWGYDALRVLTSPTYGLEDVWRSQFVFGVGRYLGLGPMGLIQLAAFFGTVKLAVAGICAVHIADRFRHLSNGTPSSEVLEGAMILVVLISIVSAAPAVWSHNPELVREQAIQIGFAMLAVALGILERSYARSAPAEEPVAANVMAKLPQDATWFAPWR